MTGGKIAFPQPQKSLRRHIRDGLLNLLCSRHLPTRAALLTLYKWHDLPHRVLHIDDSWPKPARDSFRFYNDIGQKAYAYQIPGLSVVDGRSGFAASGLRVIRESLPYDVDALLPFPMLSIRAALAGGSKVVEHALSLRDPYELNYFHFINDVAGKVMLVREHLSDQGIRTLIISRALYEQSWFRPMQRMQLFNSLQWRIQEADEPLVCRDLTVAKSPPHHLPYFEQVVANSHKLVEGRKSPYGERLLLIRQHSVRNQRIPTNQEALQKRLVSQGFTAIDPAALPWEEQVLALRYCRLLVGVHGAGMTNLIYRGHQPLGVVEIFPPTKIPPHYYWLTTLFGHRYTPIIAPTDFEVNIDDVADAAERCNPL